MPVMLQKFWLTGKCWKARHSRKEWDSRPQILQFRESGKEIRFLCRGKGHGLGFSQYGGNEMAKESANAKRDITILFS